MQIIGKLYRGFNVNIKNIFSTPFRGGTEQKKSAYYLIFIP